MFRGFNNVSGPFAGHVDVVEQYLSNKGYTQSSIDNRLGWLLQLSNWLKDNHIDHRQLHEAQLMAFVRYRKQFNRHYSIGWIKPIVECLIELGVVSTFKANPIAPLDKIDYSLQSYRRFLIFERNLKSTCAHMCILKRFLKHRFGSKSPNPRLIRAVDLTDFVVSQSHIYSIGTTKYIVSALRSYCGFLYASGRIPNDLTGSIPSIAGWRFTNIPKGLDPKVVTQILQVPDRRTDMGLRDYAILLLLARLGLRRKEIASLQLDDINWEQGELLIRGKGRRFDRLPLSNEIGSALCAHLRSTTRRNPHSRAIFLRSRTPFDALTSGAILHITARACRLAGIPSFGTHRFRHTLATQTLKLGGCLDEVAQILRHSSHNTTAIYAKVDFKALYNVICAWPGGVS